MHFLYFTGLWALTALAVPVILHLWRPPLRTIRLGSIRFLQALPRQRLHTVGLRERLLLLARLLLLTLLGLLMAAPFWRRAETREPQKWALVSLNAPLDEPASKRLDSLLSTGYELHGLAPGFPFVNADAARSIGANINAPQPLDVWSLVRELDATLPLGSTLTVFTRGRVSELRGPRPLLRRIRVEWVQTSGNTADKHFWVYSSEHSFASGSEELVISVGVSCASSTRYVSRKIPARAGRVRLDETGAGFELEITVGNSGEYLVRIADADGQPAHEWVQAGRPAPLRVLIFHGGDRVQDAVYLEAAVRTAAQVMGREIILTNYLDNQPAPTDLSMTGWVFWLSSQAATEPLLHLTAGGWKLITDAAAGQAIYRDSNIIIPSDVTNPRFRTDGVTLSKHVASLSSDAVSLWTDSFGESLLTRAIIGKGERLNLSSRFHPAWNDLPKTGALADMMLSLFNDESKMPSTQSAHDLRIAGINQGAPNISMDRQPAVAITPRKENTTDLHVLFWILIVLCFCMERLFSHWLRSPGREHTTSGFETSALEVAQR